MRAESGHGDSLLRISREMNRKPEDFIDFSCNINPLPHPESFKEHIINSFAAVKYYPDSSYTHLKELLAEYSGVHMDYIVPGNGGIEILYLYSLYAKFKNVLIVSPTFSEYEKFFTDNGAHVSFFKLNESESFIPDCERLYNEAVNGYDLVILCNPNNPTGHYIDRGVLIPLLAKLFAKNIKVLLDESFIEFTGEMGGVSDIADKNLFIVRSLTKFFGIPGLRLGYGITRDTELLQTINTKRVPWSINAFAVAAAEYLPGNKEFIRKSCALITEERDFMNRELNKIPGLKIYSTSTDFILIQLLSFINASILADELLKNGIIIRNASNFRYLDGQFFRVAVKSRDANSGLIKVLKTILSAHQ